jgi:hypothetical protein
MLVSPQDIEYRFTDGFAMPYFIFYAIVIELFDPEKFAVDSAAAPLDGLARLCLDTRAYDLAVLIEIKPDRHFEES